MISPQGSVKKKGEVPLPQSRKEMSRARPVPRLEKHDGTKNKLRKATWLPAEKTTKLRVASQTKFTPSKQDGSSRILHTKMPRPYWKKSHLPHQAPMDPVGW